MKRPAAILLPLIFIAAIASADTELSTFNDPSKSITVESGQLFVITLESNRTTGYEWQIAQPPDKSALELIGVEYVKPGGAIVGAGGRENWTFRAICSARGSVPLAFKYVRPWEKGVQPAKAITFFVTVTKGPDERRLEQMQREMDKVREESWDTSGN